MPDAELWTNGERTVCVRQRCAGDELCARLMLARGLEQKVEVAGETWEKMTKVVAQELAVLLEPMGAAPTCTCGDVEYDARSQMFTSTGRMATR